MNRNRKRKLRDACVIRVMSKTQVLQEGPLKKISARKRKFQRVYDNISEIRQYFASHDSTTKKFKYEETEEPQEQVEETKPMNEPKKKKTAKKRKKRRRKKKKQVTSKDVKKEQETSRKKKKS